MILHRLSFHSAEIAFRNFCFIDIHIYLKECGAPFAFVHFETNHCLLGNICLILFNNNLKRRGRADSIPAHFYIAAELDFVYE